MQWHSIVSKGVGHSVLVIVWLKYQQSTVRPSPKYLTFFFFETFQSTSPTTTVRRLGQMNRPNMGFWGAVLNKFL